jgi:hypothetical protein
MNRTSGQTSHNADDSNADRLAANPDGAAMPAAPPSSACCRCTRTSC